MPTLNSDPNIHYVKFIRGSIQAWENLKLTPQKIDNDTLYFIYTSAENTTEGKIYLGQKLLSGGDGSGNINIGDIGNLVIDGETLQDKQILVYNETTDQWENTSLSTIINTAVSDFLGATNSTNGAHGLVPAPLVTDRDKFLRGDGSWASVNIPTFDTNVFTISAANQVTLAGIQQAQIGTIPIKTNAGIQWTELSGGTLTRQITTMQKLEAQLSGEDPDPLDTNTIYMVPSGSASSSNHYDEYMIIGNALELLGTFGSVNLSDYVQTSVYQAEVKKLEDTLYDHSNPETGDLIPGIESRIITIESNYVSKAEIGDLNNLILSGNNTTLVDEVNTINTDLINLTERMKWHELSE